MGTLFWIKELLITRERFCGVRNVDLLSVIIQHCTMSTVGPRYLHAAQNLPRSRQVEMLKLKQQGLQYSPRQKYVCNRFVLFAVRTSTNLRRATALRLVQLTQWNHVQGTAHPTLTASQAHILTCRARGRPLRAHQKIHFPAVLVSQLYGRSW